MSEKSHVGMGYSLCPICLTKHDEVVLLDQRLRNSLEREQCVGWDFCPTCAPKVVDFVALVAVTNGGPVERLQDAKRTGEYAWLKRTVAAEVLDVDLSGVPFTFCEAGVINKLKEMQRGLDEQSPA